jgi:hypothetical protein
MSQELFGKAASERPYEAVARQILALIGWGEIAPGWRLPAERDLAEPLASAVACCARHSGSWRRGASCSPAPEAGATCGPTTRRPTPGTGHGLRRRRSPPP